MTMIGMKLNEIDKVEVTCLVNNHVNLLLQGTEVAHRPSVTENWFERPPIAEHGFSVVVTFEISGIKHQILFDSGLSPWAASYNADTLGCDLSNCEAVTLSHGHIDHAGGVLAIRKKMKASSIPLLVHKEAFRNRLFKFPDGPNLNLPAPNKSLLVQSGYEIVETNSPRLCIQNSILVTGEIPKTRD